MIWIALFSCAGVPVAGALAWWSWRNSRHGALPWKARALVAGALPYALIAVGLAWFIGYAIIAGSLGMDPGLGDSWSVPLTNGYFFCMIDVPDKGYLMKDGCSGSPPVDGITRLAQCGNFVTGSNGSATFLFDTARDVLVANPSQAVIDKECGPSIQLQAANEFYGARRSGWLDLGALAVLLGLVTSISVFWHGRFIRERKVVA
ncbi:MAG: hypothetical protein K1Y01_05925 [Vicinamibacteria bacterium]|nr:hypothetical protein [Vicinamibacteria bacterium]